MLNVDITLTEKYSRKCSYECGYIIHRNKHVQIIIICKSCTVGNSIMTRHAKLYGGAVTEND